MPDFADLLQRGGAHAWLYFPSAILLGALHGLEPGHSKTMMAAFIVAIRGSVKQAVMLGLAATLSHTAVVWLVAIGGMYLGQGLDAETTEPYFQLASSALIIAIALWMLWRTWRGEQLFKFEEENGAHCDHHDHEIHHQSHDHDLEHQHGHSHDHGNPQRFTLAAEGYQDAHEKAHAEDIRKRFSHREVSNGQILMFGLTGGLIPCPAAITVLLLCLQVKQVTLGAAMVLCFSIGLAITLVTVGAAAAICQRQLKSDPLPC
ncbi:nickel/cobalt efflux protein RcnA [Pseudomonas amygdali pv. aesculi]|nr:MULTISPECIES: nickel/cobalt efflux protein RcnA [Pseudomonas syringae group genomosp. 2]WGP99891.1 nickel/cobalt efflux protein RcnA [Pseudomonas amygdali pv. aesculi]